MLIRRKVIFIIFKAFYFARTNCSSCCTSTGYIDLSKRRVDPEDVVKCEERYNKAKAVHSVLTHVAKTHNLQVEDLCKRVGWPLYRKYGHAYDAFKIALK